MSEAILEKIRDALQGIEERYHRLILLVGEIGSGKTSILQQVAKERGVKIININLALSTQLLELSSKQRTLLSPKLLAELVEEELDLVLLDNIEILFDKSLQQDPLRLLQGISRNRTVLAAWNGSVVKEKLIYAQPNHPEYQCYDVNELEIVEMATTPV
ncbi:BREX-3 system P-loop-containing protein BrxF [Deltaproteobacteria bacterium TL4]